MRALVALTLVVVIAMACGGGASSPPIRVAPAVTSTPSGATPAPSGGYDYGGY